MTIKVNGQPIRAQILPIDKPTLDETLETFSFSLVINNKPKPFAPCQKVQVITDSNETINLFLVSDNVEIFSVKPLRYKHTITCVQNTRILSKHLVRNSVFSQPSNPIKESYNATTFSLYDRRAPQDESNLGINTNGRYHVHSLCPTLNSIEKFVTLDLVNESAREKIKQAFVEIRCSAILCPKGTVDLELPGPGGSYWFNPDNIQDLRDQTTNSTTWTLGYLNLYCEKPDGTPKTEILLMGDLGGWNFNRKMRCRRIEELAEQGYTKFSIRFRDDYIGGTCYPYKDKFFLTISFQAIISLETYYYNCNEILYLLRERQRQIRVENGVFIQPSALFNLPESGSLHNLLVSTPAPNFIFTQSTMYECVAEVFRLFDAIFTMDSNDELGIEYFNETNGTDVSATLRKTGENLTSSEDKYTNGLVAYYQDGRTTETFPTATSKLGGYAPIRCRSLGVPTDPSSFTFITPHPIDNVQHCYIHFANASGMKISIVSDFGFAAGAGYVSVGTSDTNALYGNPILDIAHWIVYQDLWTELSTDGSASIPANSDPFTRYQITTLSFVRGSNEINVSYAYMSNSWIPQQEFAFDNVVNRSLWALLGVKTESTMALIHSTLTDWRQVSMKVIYMTSVDGRVKVESIDRKYDGETLIDQYNGAVDLNKMGVNILGLTLKLGNPTLTVTQKITTWANRIKPGDIYNYENKKWIANVVTYTILNDGYVQSTIQFVQNFNALSLRTRLLREKRMSNISSQLTCKSEDNITSYVYTCVRGGNTDAPTGITYQSIAFNNIYLGCDIAASLGVSEWGQDTIELLTDYYSPDVAIYGSSELIYLPMIKYGSGNTICFEMSFDDPMNAGNQTKAVESGWFFGNLYKYFTKAIKYTDDLGFAQDASIRIVSSRNVTIDDNFPLIQSYNTNYRVATIGGYRIYKQPNEIFALNYQLCFLPYESGKDFIGTEFINNNFLVNRSIRKVRDLIVYYGNEKYSVLDTKGNPQNSVFVNDASVEFINDQIFITLTLVEKIWGDAFSVCDANGNILFASNRRIANTDRIYITFTTSRVRQDNKVLEDLS